MSSLCLGQNQIEIERGLPPAARLFSCRLPPASCSRRARLYITVSTPLSNNLIMANRKNLKNPNGLFLGTPGSGKVLFCQA